MLEMKNGSIVKSMAGHDSGNLFVVLRQEGDYVLLADGKRRKKEKPKRKKWKHVRLVEAEHITITDDLTDKKIRTLLGAAQPR